MRLDTRLRTLRDVNRFALAALLIPIVLSVIVVGGFASPGPHAIDEYLVTASQWWVGEAVGLFSVTPFLLVVALPWLRGLSEEVRKGKSRRFRWRLPSARTIVIDFSEGLGVFLALWLMFRSGLHFELGLYYLAFLPLVVIALHHGLRGAVVATLLINFGSTLLFRIDTGDLNTVAAFQVFMLVLSLTGLYLGLLVTQRRETEESYRNVVEQSLQGIVVFHNGRILFSNRGAAEMVGYEVGELLAMEPDGVARIIHPEDRRMVLESLGVSRADHPEPQRYEFRALRKDGSERWLDFSATRVTYEGAAAVQAAIVDITERKRAEQVIAASEQRFRALIEHSSDAIVLLDAEATVRYASPSATRILPAPVDALIGKTVEGIHTDDLTSARQLFRIVLENPGVTYDSVVRFDDRDGGRHCLEGTITNLLNVPSVKGIVGNYRDVSERKRAEEETRRQATRAEALARTAARLNAQLDLGTVLNAICEESARAINVPAAALRLYDPRRDELHFAGSYGLPHDFSGFKPSPRALYDELAAQQGDLIIAQDVQSLTNVPNREMYAEFNIRTVVTAIIRRGSQLIGGLSIFTIGEPREFSEDELALLRGLANQGSQAIVNARLLDATERSLQRLRALRSIDTAITASVDLNFTLNRVLEEVTAQLRVDAADILQYNERENVLQYAASLGFRSNALRYTRLQLGEGYAGAAALERRMIKVPVLSEAIDGFGRAPLLLDEDFVSYYAMPLLAKAQIKGVLEIFHRTRLEAEPEWEEFLEALAGQATIAMDNGQLFLNLQQSNFALRAAYDSTLEGWSRALDLRDEETEGHTQRVTELTLRLARVMGLDEEELGQIRRGALLHDIGKMGIPDNILLKPGPLTEEEWAIMRKHPVYAYELMAPITYLRAAQDIPYCHHEKWDGTGYPRGLRGEQIPLAARIFAIVDVWDALRSDRPYRQAWSEETVCDYIRGLAGTHFEPKIVEVFLGMSHANNVETLPFEGARAILFGK